MLVVRRAAGAYIVDNLVSRRQCQAGRTGCMEHPRANPRRPCLGVDHSRDRAARGVWFVGETRRAAQARSAAEPILQNRLTTYAIVAGALLVLREAPQPS